MRTVLAIALVCLLGAFAVSQVWDDDEIPSGEQAKAVFDVARQGEYAASNEMRRRMNGE